MKKEEADMVTRFVVGQQVRALASVQGLVDGVVYEVVGIRSRATPWGVFVTYQVKAMPGGSVVSVMNGHLVLGRV